jgi:hypothetical protein
MYMAATKIKLIFYEIELHTYTPDPTQQSTEEVVEGKLQNYSLTICFCALCHSSAAATSTRKKVGI